MGDCIMDRKHNPQLTATARALRKNMTKEERRLWFAFLHTYPVRFLRQKVIDGYVVDFYCHQARLVLELDGSQHFSEEGLLKDRVRTEKIKDRNLTVVRIANSDIHQHFDEVCAYIDRLVKESLAEK